MLFEFAARPLEATFLRRANRFVVEAELAGELVTAHLPNSGRLSAVLVAGRSCWLRPARTPGRRTAFDLLAIDTDRGTVLVDSQLPNRLVSAALDARLLPGADVYQRVKAEYRHGDSRLDFALFGESQPTCLIEVKSATDDHERVARFPDAPSPRAVKHLRELISAASSGYLTAVIFLAQMSWAEAVLLNESIDPLFVQTAGEARAAGVRLLGFTLEPQLPEGVDWGQSIPVLVP